MKKNLLSVLILVLLIVNIVLSAVTMTSVVSTNSKTADLMDSIAAVLNLELYEPGNEANVPLADVVPHDVGTMTIGLTASVNADGTAGKPGYIIFDLSLQMDSKHEDYATLGANISERDSLIKDAVTRVVGSHTEAECRADLDEGIRDEILRALQDLFQSKFIFKISISGVKYSG